MRRVAKRAEVCLGHPSAFGLKRVRIYCAPFERKTKKGSGKKVAKNADPRGACFFECFLTPTAENPWFGLSAMLNRPPTLVVASRQERATQLVLSCS